MCSQLPLSALDCPQQSRESGLKKWVPGLKKINFLHDHINKGLQKENNGFNFRLVGLVAGLLWGSGFLISSFGISARKIWVLYLGYGVLGGAGLGLAYVSPVSTLIR